jgi:hypothetical protein
VIPQIGSRSIFSNRAWLCLTQYDSRNPILVLLLLRSLLPPPFFFIFSQISPGSVSRRQLPSALNIFQKRASRQGLPLCPKAQELRCFALDPHPGPHNASQHTDFNAVHSAHTLDINMLVSKRTSMLCTPPYTLDLTVLFRVYY